MGCQGLQMGCSLASPTGTQSRAKECREGSEHMKRGWQMRSSKFLLIVSTQLHCMHLNRLNHDISIRDLCCPLCSVEYMFTVHEALGLVYSKQQRKRKSLFSLHVSVLLLSLSLEIINCTIIYLLDSFKTWEVFMSILC